MIPKSKRFLFGVLGAIVLVVSAGIISVASLRHLIHDEIYEILEKEIKASCFDVSKRPG